MVKRKIMFLLACVSALSMFTACGSNVLTTGTSGTDETVSSTDSTGSETSTTGTSTETDTTSTTVDEALANDSENHDTSDGTDTGTDTSDIIQIVLNGTSITVTPSTGATVDGSKVTITAAGTYSVSGSLSNGQIIVNAPDAIVKLILNGASITCSNSAPIYVVSAKETIIASAENTQNYVTDGSSYVFEDATATEPNAAIFAKSDLTIGGTGSLTVKGNYDDGIASKDGLIITSGTIAVTAVDDGIRGKDYLIVKGGTTTITATGDGLKADNAEDTTKGYVLIEGGTLNITSGGDGIAAETDALVSDGKITVTSGGGSSKMVAADTSAKGIKGVVNVIIDGGTFTINSADDAIHSNNNVILNNGTYTVATNDDAIHSEASITINGGTFSVSKCYEGLESPAITVNAGNISIVSSDDGFNATVGNGGEANDGSFLHINGGTIAVNSSKGDGLDSNGSIVMTAGTVVVHGPQSQPEVAADFNGTFSISGGLLIASGPNSGNMIQAPSTSSTQNCVKASCASGSLAASTFFHVQDSSGNDIVTFKPVRTTYYIVFSSPALITGSSYSIYTGGTSTGTNTNGLYTGGTYSGGTQKKTFSISSKITNVSF